MTAPGSLYLDAVDGELVQVLPPSAWDPDRWGPPAPLPVVRILAPGARDRWRKPGEIAQRDLTSLTLVPPAAVEALRALAGGGVLASLATAAAKRADAIGCGFATQGGGMPNPGWVTALARDALARGDFAEAAALALFGMSLGLPKPPAPLVPVAPSPGSLYLDSDGELVQVLPATAWDPERWGPADPGLTVCRVLASAPRYEATGEVVQRDLGGCLLLRDAAGRVPAALRALAGAG